MDSPHPCAQQPCSMLLRVALVTASLYSSGVGVLGLARPGGGWAGWVRACVGQLSLPPCPQQQGRGLVWGMICLGGADCARVDNLAAISNLQYTPVCVVHNAGQPYLDKVLCWVQGLPSKCCNHSPGHPCKPARACMSVCRCACVCMHACLHVCVCAHVCACACTYVCVRECTCMHVYVPMHV